MRTATDDMKSHLIQEVISLSLCWKLTLANETVMGFTDHGENLTIEGQLYKASTGFSPTTIETTNQFSVDNLDVTGILRDASITESDIMAGLYDFAEVHIFMVNGQDLTQGIITHRKGWLGEVTLQGDQFTAEIRGLSQKLSQNIGELYTPTCRAILGDSRCGVDVSSYTISGTVDTTTNRQVLTCNTLTQEAGYFTNGEILWMTGQNATYRMEIKEFANKQVTLMLPMSSPIAPSDTFEIMAGCNKTLKICKATFNNVLNFRGEPHVPGMNKILSNASTANDLESG